MRFILVRHATTDWNAAGRLQGQTDIPLGERGRAEAAAFAPSLNGLGITHIVSSDLQRAIQTAEIFNAVLAVPTATDVRLREVSFGAVQGLTKEEALATFGEKVKIAWDGEGDDITYDFRDYGGEESVRVAERHIAALQALKERYPGETILLVGHSKGFNTLLRARGLPAEMKRNEYRIIEY